MPEVFSNAQGMRPDAPSMPFMINLDDPLHKKRRNLVNKGFTLKRVAAREPKIRRVCAELIERAKERGRFDFVMDLAAWLPLIVIGENLGIEEDRYPELLKWSDDMVKGTGAADLETMEQSNVAFSEYYSYQREIIADRRGRPPCDDLVSILCHSKIDGEGLDDEEILWESLLILIGGDETTRHVITGGMYQLLRHPEQLAALRADRSKIPTAVEEMLRWVTPIQNMSRTATRDVEFGGQKISEGDKLLLLYGSANRDSEKFDDPDTFDITRDPNEHIAFGFGAHFCLGASLARLELRVFFEELLDRVPEIELTAGGDPPRRISNFIVGIEQMPVEFRG